MILRLCDLSLCRIRPSSAKFHNDHMQIIRVRIDSSHTSRKKLSVSMPRAFDRIDDLTASRSVNFYVNSFSVIDPHCPILRLRAALETWRSEDEVPNANAMVAASQL